MNNFDYKSFGVRSKGEYVQGGNLKGINRNAKGSPADSLAEEKRPLVKLYGERWEQGLDLWTGEPLEGAGLADWKNQRKKRNQLE
jgi:hypothetical protein